MAKAKTQSFILELPVVTPLATDRVLIAMNKTVDAAQAGKNAAHQAKERKYQDSMMDKNRGDVTADKGGKTGDGEKNGKNRS
jgi:hypothetical protein